VDVFRAAGEGGDAEGAGRLNSTPFFLRALCLITHGIAAALKEHCYKCLAHRKRQFIPDRERCFSGRLSHSFGVRGVDFLCGEQSFSYVLTPALGAGSSHVVLLWVVNILTTCDFLPQDRQTRAEDVASRS